MKEVLNFATTVDSGHKGRILSAYNFEYVIYKWTYFPVWSLKFKINDPQKERVSEAKPSMNVPNEKKNLRRRNKIDSLLKIVRKVSV
jgi:hypothetical protein